ncbi:DUF4145 domain-containing protein [Paenibacillus sp. ALE1]
MNIYINNKEICEELEWNNQLSQLEPCQYSCGYCGMAVASKQGYASIYESVFVYFCPLCNLGTTFIGEEQFPPLFYGEKVEHVNNESVESLYFEARVCAQFGAYTSATMACRKILMNIAVSKGAQEGNSFAYYVQYLEDNRHITSDSREWVDRIRKIGNEANHEINRKSRMDAETLIDFVGMLLKLVFEYPVKGKIKSTTENNFKDMNIDRMPIISLPIS